MSLYNALLGKNKHYEEILDLIDINEKDVERFRDAYLSDDARTVKVYTRTGGPNRKDHETFICWMRTYPTFLNDYDDTFDETFMTFEFAVPGQNYGKALELLKDSDTRTGQQKFQDLMKSLEDGSGWDNPRVKKVNGGLEKAFSQGSTKEVNIILVGEDGNVEVK